MNQVVDALLAALLFRTVGMIQETGKNKATFDVIAFERPQLIEDFSELLLGFRERLGLSLQTIAKPFLDFLEERFGILAMPSAHSETVFRISIARRLRHGEPNALKNTLSHRNHAILRLATQMCFFRIASSTLF